MAGDRWVGVGLWSVLLLSVVVAAPRAGAEGPGSQPPQAPGAAGSSPPEAIIINAERIDYARHTETLQAEGSVEVVQGETKLTADQVTAHILTGDVVAVGRVHLLKGDTDIWADRLQLNFNTEAGFVTSGRIYDRDTNALITANQLRRYSEDHYRAKEGSFTNCDAMGDQVPDWRFTFEEVDLTFGDSLSIRNAWFCVKDVPLIPVPYFRYPIGVSRKTGFLFPSPGYNTEFGFNYRQSFFWAITPSQDLTLTPNILTDRGFGGDVEYRYILSRTNRGQWLLNGFQDSEQDRGRGFISGSHSALLTPDLSLRARAFLVSDPSYLQDLGNVSALRALPSTDSTLDLSQRLPNGRAFLLAQYLQQVAVGGADTFQRLPEIGYRLTDLPLFDSALLLSFDGTYDYFYREEGFDLSRIDVMPALTTQPLNLGNVVGLTPAVRPRGVYYSRGSTTAQVVHRETIWSSLRANTSLRRRFGSPGERMVVHTVEPSVIYEYVPSTDQSDLVQIDNIDDLPEKHLITYMLTNRLVGVGQQGGPSTWLDLTVAQSYHVTDPPRPSAATQAGTGLRSRRFSDVWLRGDLQGAQLPGLPTGVTPSLTVDTFVDPYEAAFSQINTDLRLQYEQRWYATVGQRFARSGRKVQRGDIWNPLSFGQAFDPSPEIQFLTASGAIRLTSDLTVGSRIFREFETRSTPEFDVVALYQSPCRCWSLGLYFQDFPDRSQFNFLISLRDIGSTDDFGAQLLKTLLSPLLAGAKGLPW